MQAHQQTEEKEEEPRQENLPTDPELGLEDTYCSSHLQTNTNVNQVKRQIKHNMAQKCDNNSGQD